MSNQFSFLAVFQSSFFFIRVITRAADLKKRYFTQFNFRIIIFSHCLDCKSLIMGGYLHF